MSQTAQGVAAWRQPGCVIAAGGLALLLPTLWDYLFGQWSGYSQGHELLLLAVVAWLLARQWAGISALPDAGPRWWSLLGLGAGLAAYAFGRTQEFIRIEMISLWWTTLCLMLMWKGVAGLRRAWFAWAFALFVMPIPFSVVLMLTAPLKEAVSALATLILGAVGYPIGRTGVIITVGQYQLLVAEACAGLQSMFILEAMGLLYSYLVSHRSWVRNAMLAALAVPVSFTANVVRVMILVIVTYHFGDAVGQGFVHHFAGVVLFAVALALMGALDGLLGLWWPDGNEAAAAPEGLSRVVSVRTSAFAAASSPAAALPASAEPAASGAVCAQAKGHAAFTAAAAWALALAMVAIAGISFVFLPKPMPDAEARARTPLEQIFPARFGDWQLDPSTVALIRPAFDQARRFQMYDQVLERTYLDGRGHRVMVSVAYGRQQSVGLQMHRPEVCYKAGGFRIADVRTGSLSLMGRPVPVTRLFASMDGRAEPITYWRLLGRELIADEQQFKLRQLSFGAARTIPDGLLVRLSSLDEDPAAGYRLQAAFAEAMVDAMTPAQRARALGW